MCDMRVSATSIGFAIGGLLLGLLFGWVLSGRAVGNGEPGAPDAATPPAESGVTVGAEERGPDVLPVAESTPTPGYDLPPLDPRFQAYADSRPWKPYPIDFEWTEMHDYVVATFIVPSETMRGYWYLVHNGPASRGELEEAVGASVGTWGLGISPVGWDGPIVPGKLVTLRRDGGPLSGMYALTDLG